MKYVILIHSNPQPWGHPTGDYVAEFQALPKERRDAMNADFEALLGELSENGELVGGEALADPSGARLYRWEPDEPLATDGPYSEAKEHLAGFFLDRRRDPRARRGARGPVAGPGRHGRAAARRCPTAATTSDRAGRRQLEDVWRRESPHVLGALLRRHGDSPTARTPPRRRWRRRPKQWPRRGVPDDPRGVAGPRRVAPPVDRARADRARAAREEAVGIAQPADAFVAPPADDDADPRRRRPAAAAALLPPGADPRLAGGADPARRLGLTPPPIAAAFLVPEATMAQRLSRARTTLRAAGARFEAARAEELPSASPRSSTSSTSSSTRATRGAPATRWSTPRWPTRRST